MLQRLALAAMGTRFELVLEGDQPVQLQALGEEALEEVRRAEQLFSRFRRDSWLAHLHRSGGRAVRVELDVLQFFQLCQEAARLSESAFHPCLAAPPLRPEEVLQVDAERNTVRLRQGQSLDLGGVGKGFALDQAADVLRSAGIRRALLHAGTSSVLALGSMRVAIRHPDPNQPAPLASADLTDQCLSVSATLGPGDPAFRRAEGHVVDPRDGQRLSQPAVAAVVASSAALADAWSTALLVWRQRGGAPLPAVAGVQAALYHADGLDPEVLLNSSQVLDLEADATRAASQTG